MGFVSGAAARQPVFAKNGMVVAQEPLATDVGVSPPPSSGGVGILQMLEMLEGTD